MRAFIPVAALLSIILVGAGCKPRPSLVGKWTSLIEGQKCTFEFTKDDHMTQSMTVEGVEIVLHGDYRVVGGKVRTVYKEVTVKGVPEIEKAAVERAVKEEMKGLLNKPDVSSLNFASTDEVSLSGSQNPTITLTRVKVGT